MSGVTFQVGLTAFVEFLAILWYMRIPARPIGCNRVSATTAATNLRKMRLLTSRPATVSPELFSDRYCSKLLRLNAFFCLHFLLSHVATWLFFLPLRLPSI